MPGRWAPQRTLSTSFLHVYDFCDGHIMYKFPTNTRHVTVRAGMTGSERLETLPISPALPLQRQTRLDAWLRPVLDLSTLTRKPVRVRSIITIFKLLQDESYQISGRNRCVSGFEDMQGTL